jgi:hypothetical protein
MYYASMLTPKFLREALAIAPEEPLYISLQGILHAVQGDDGPALDCIRRACESPHSFGHDHHTYYQLGCSVAKWDSLV